MTKYEIIKKEIKEQIKDNILKPNQVIKSENEMCQCYDVSRVTVRKAIDELCAEGILYRIKGKGCFVRELKDKKRRIYSFTEAVKNEGKTPSKKQLSLKTMNADAYLAEKLQITEGDEVYEIRSLYYADGVPYSLNTAVLPAKRSEKLDFFDFNNRSLYEVLGSFLSYGNVQGTSDVGSSYSRSRDRHGCWNGKKASRC